LLRAGAEDQMETAFQGPDESVDSPGAPLAYELSAAYQAYLEDGCTQPHERYAERPPFYPTHVFAEFTVHLDGQVHVVQEMREVMVIDGLGYVRESWEDGSLPDYDVDRYGAWYDLDLDRLVDRSWGPDPLPDRYAMWQETDATAHLFGIEPTWRGVRELTITDSSLSTAVVCAVEASSHLEPYQEANLRAALADLPRDGWEITRQEVLAVMSGDLERFGDPDGRGVDNDGSAHTWYRTAARPFVETAVAAPCAVPTVNMLELADDLAPAPGWTPDPSTRLADIEWDLAPAW
jgi:hypothetical protein